MKRLLLASAALLLFSAAPATAASTQARPAIGAWGVDTTSLSKTVRPGDDFYRYVNEGWLSRSKAPTGFPYINSFVEVMLSTEQRVSGIITAAREAKAAPGSPEQLIGDYHRAHSDMARRNALGITPIASTLSIIAGTTDRVELARIMALPWMDGFVGAGVLADASNPTQQIAAIGTGGLTMPRDYYLSPDEPYVGHRTALRDYMADSLRRADVSDPEGRADKVMALEVEIARRTWSTAQLRDAVAMNRVMSPTELAAFAPGIPWAQFLSEQGLGGQPRIKVTSNTAVRDLAKLFADTPVADLQSFLLFKTLDEWAPSLSETWVQSHFDFHGKRIQDTPQRRAAEFEHIAAVNKAFGEEVGRLYVGRYFKPEQRAEVLQIVDYLRAAYRDRIAKVDWMDEPTRAEALNKLEKITAYIGYPERWHDRSSIRIAPDDLVGNRNRIAAWERADSLKKLTEGTRRWEFPYNPHEINAGYSPGSNSMTYPAGILQPPFFDPAADAAVNFGSLAAVIGHEIGHGFDDQGSRSDGEGRLRNWWSASSRAEFERRTARLIEQFNGYEAVPGLRINGRQNLGENIGDLGGLSIAYSAYQKFVGEKQGGKAPVVDGFTGNQRFFLAWSQLWRNITNEGELRRQVLTDPHSPGEFRVNGIVRNVDGWYDAFGVKPGDALYLPPSERVRIW